MPQPDYFAAMQRARRLQSEEVWRVIGVAARALKRLAAALADRRRARRERRRAVAALLAMDKRSLNDLGLTHAYVRFAAERGGAEPPAPANCNSDRVKSASAA